MTPSYGCLLALLGRAVRTTPSYSYPDRISAAKEYATHVIENDLAKKYDNGNPNPILPMKK